MEMYLCRGLLGLSGIRGRSFPAFTKSPIYKFMVRVFLVTPMCSINSMLLPGSSQNCTTAFCLAVASDQFVRFSLFANKALRQLYLYFVYTKHRRDEIHPGGLV